jgi:hypothetical protein
VISRAQVFLDRSGRVLDGHVPAAEVDHTTTELPVGAIEWRSFELRSRCRQFVHHARRSF